MTERTTELPECIVVKCPDCAGEGRYTGTGEDKHLAHADACPQAALPLLERTYNVLIDAADA